MHTGIVFDRVSETHRYLIDAKEVSMAVEVEEMGRKSVLLSAASEFEDRICELVREFARKASCDDERIMAMIEKKVISRQYHTWFDWRSPSANPFFAMFGEKFCDKLKKLKVSDASFACSVDAFLEVGQLRNLLVHNNFATFVIEKTTSEIFELSKLANDFVVRIGLELQDSVAAPVPP